MMHGIITSASSVDLSHIRDSSQYGSLVWAGYLGEYGRLAIANVVLAQYNPAGRLPIRFCSASYVQYENATIECQSKSNI